MQALNGNDTLIVVSIPAVTMTGVKNGSDCRRGPFGQSKKRVIPALSGNRVRVNLPSESVRTDGSSTMTPLVRRSRRTRMINPAIAFPVPSSVTTPCRRRGL